MSNYAQIKLQLKALKLSGMFETVELRLMEAERNSLAFSEAFAMLLSDESDARKNRKLDRLTKRAHLEANKTLESFDFSANVSLNAARIRELATCRFIEKAENLFLLGPTGTGKTHLAKAIAHAACRQDLTVDFFSFHDFFNAIAKADLAQSLEQLTKTLVKTDLLVIDDFAFRKIDNRSAECFYAIVDQRYTLRSILLTSNRAISDWSAIFPDPIMANAVMDRLAHNAHQITIKGESYRKNFAPRTGIA
jgi:DNA replication protein DnaC